MKQMHASLLSTKAKLQEKHISDVKKSTEEKELRDVEDELVRSFGYA